jgi:imidazolonepropionase-like amidohydrolase
MLTALRTRCAALMLALAPAACTTHMQPSMQPSLVIRNIAIVAADRPEVSVGAVAVRDGRITYVGPADGLPAAPNAQVIDGAGRFLVPGLIDMHSHVSKTRGSSLGLLVARGVTTVRDMGGDHEELLQWRKEIASGHRLGPRLVIAGPYLESAKNAARQHGTPAHEMIEPVERTRIGVGTPADADRIIAQVATRGVDHLKIRTVEDRATYLAIGAAARRHGLALTGHFQRLPFNDFFASGQRSIEHALIPSLQERPAAERAAFISRLARERIAAVPTLVVLESLGGPDDASLKARVEAAEKGGRRLLSAYLRAEWREQLAEQGPDRQKVYEQFHRNARRDFAEMRAAGVRILAGTDIGVLNIVPGRSMHDELALLVRDIGMTPHEALQAATVHAAAFMGLDREVGSIATGTQADMILLDANPLDDIAHISRISGVVLRGQYFDRSGLDKILDDVMASPDVAANDWPRKK